MKERDPDLLGSGSTREQDRETGEDRDAAKTCHECL
jgi:hypothetical protein